MADQLTTQQTLRISLLASVAARHALGLLNVENLLIARMQLADVISAISAIDAELKKIAEGVNRG